MRTALLAGRTRMPCCGRMSSTARRRRRRMAGPGGLRRAGTGGGNSELQYYTDLPANAALDGAGHLAIVVRRPGPAQPGAASTAAAIPPRGWSARTGCGSATGWCRPGSRSRGSAGSGPAFWMLGQDIDRAGWPRCGEIDVMEHFGTGAATIHGTVHGPGVLRPFGHQRVLRRGLSPVA